MIFFSPKNSFLLSALIHLIFIILYALIHTTTFKSDIINIPIQNGYSSSLHFRINAKGKSNTVTENNVDDSFGSQTIQKEIYRIQKSIPYPESALLRGLESDCEWLVTVAENGIPENVETTRNCRYEIFESAFKNIASHWKFQLPKGTKIRIPVSFRIVDKNE